MICLITRPLYARFIVHQRQFYRWSERQLNSISYRIALQLYDAADRCSKLSVTSLSSLTTDSARSTVRQERDQTEKCALRIARSQKSYAIWRKNINDIRLVVSFQYISDYIFLEIFLNKYFLDFTFFYESFFFLLKKKENISE